MTLALNGEEFASCIRLLLKHQSLIDSFACLVAGLQILQTPLWLSGKYNELSSVMNLFAVMIYDRVYISVPCLYIRGKPLRSTKHNLFLISGLRHTFRTK